MKDEVVKVQVAIDGRLTQLLDVSERLAHAAGKVEGIAQEKSDAKENK